MVEGSLVRWNPWPSKVGWKAYTVGNEAVDNMKLFIACHLVHTREVYNAIWGKIDKKLYFGLVYNITKCMIVTLKRILFERYPLWRKIWVHKKYSPFLLLSFHFQGTSGASQMIMYMRGTLNKGHRLWGNIRVLSPWFNGITITTYYGVFLQTFAQ